MKCASAIRVAHTVTEVEIETRTRRKEVELDDRPCGASYELCDLREILEIVLKVFDRRLGHDEGGVVG